MYFFTAKLLANGIFSGSQEITDIRQAHGPISALNTPQDLRIPAAQNNLEGFALA